MIFDKSIISAKSHHTVFNFVSSFRFLRTIAFFISPASLSLCVVCSPLSGSFDIVQGKVRDKCFKYGSISYKCGL